MSEILVYIWAEKEAWITCPEGYAIEDNCEITRFQLGSLVCEMFPESIKYIETDEGRDTYTCMYRMELEEMIEGDYDDVEEGEYDYMTYAVKDIVYGEMILDVEEFDDGVIVTSRDEQVDFGFEFA